MSGPSADDERDRAAMTTGGSINRYLLIGLSIGAIAIALGVWAMRDSNDACVDAGQAVAKAWHEPRRAELQHAYEHTEVAYARDAWLRTERVAGEWFQAWAQVDEQACQAGREHARQCLEAALARADALLVVMTDARPEAIAGALPAFAELPPPVRCLDAAGEPKPRNPELDRVAAMVKLGDGAGALPLARGLEGAEAAFWVGTILMQDEDPEAVELLERAFSEASREERHELASDAAVGLARSMMSADRRENAEQWAKRAVERGELGPRARLQAQATMARVAGTTDALQAVLDDATEQLGPTDPTTLAVARLLGEAALQNDALDEAQRVLADARARTIEAYGAEHPAVAIVDLGLARVDLAAGRIDAAKAKLESAADALRSSLGPQNDHTVDAVALLARAHAEAGEHEDAQRLFNGAFEVSKRAKGPDHPRTRRLAEQLAAG